MKSLFKPAGLLALLLSSAYVGHSQNNQTGSPDNSGHFMQAAATSPVYNKDKGVSLYGTPDASLLEANPALKARFSNLFPSAVQQQWCKLNDGYYVSFFSNGRKSSAVFSGKGRLSYAISDCKLEQLPDAFRDEIRKDYPGYQLLHGSEINAHHEVTYQAVLENAKQYVVLRSNGETTEKIHQVTK